jgi:hypothetical protein
MMPADRHRAERVNPSCEFIGAEDHAFQPYRM